MRSYEKETQKDRTKAKEHFQRASKGKGKDHFKFFMKCFQFDTFSFVQNVYLKCVFEMCVPNKCEKF